MAAAADRVAKVGPTAAQMPGVAAALPHGRDVLNGGLSPLPPEDRQPKYIWMEVFGPGRPQDFCMVTLSKHHGSCLS